MTTRKTADTARDVVFSIRFHPDEWAWYVQQCGKGSPMAAARDALLARVRAGKPLTAKERLPVERAPTKRSADARRKIGSARISSADRAAIQKAADAEQLAAPAWALAVLLNGWTRPVTSLSRYADVDAREVAEAVVDAVWSGKSSARSRKVTAAARVLRPIIVGLQKERAEGWRRWERVVDMVEHYQHDPSS